MKDNQTITDHLTDDLQFLIACCQIDPSVDDINFIHSFIQHSSFLELNSDTSVVKTKEGCNIQHLLTLSSQHGILPLVYKTIKKIIQDDSQSIQHSTFALKEVPLGCNIQHFLSELKQHYMLISQRNMLMSAELIRIMKLLEENEIKALAFKGPVLAQMAYGDITLRQYTDLDILVDEKEVAKAGSVLTEHGYASVFPIKILENQTCLEVTNDLGFYNEKKGILLELHWKLFREKIGQHLHFSQISENKQTVKINGKEMHTLSAEMLLVYLCLHGSKHAWERVEWICDIDRLIHSSEEIDWDKVLAIAQKMDTTISLYLGLRLSHLLFDTPLPEKIMIRTKSDRIENLITKTYIMLNSTFSNKEGYSRYKAIHIYQMELLDTKFKKIKHLFSTYFGISRNDCQSFPLPSPFRFLYIFIKPFRVLTKYIQYGK